MKNPKIDILITRQLDELQFRKLEEAGLSPDCIPFIRIEFMNNPQSMLEISKLTKENIFAVFTSSNSIEAIRKIEGIRLANWKIFCTESTTKKSAVEIFGENALIGEAENSMELAELIVQYHPETEIHFFCGDLRREDLPELLKRNQIACREWVVYHTHAAPHKTSKAYQALVFFSPSGVRSFFSKNTPENQPAIFALGQTTAAEIRNHVETKIFIPSKANIENLIDELIGFFHSRRSSIAENKTP